MYLFPAKHAQGSAGLFRQDSPPQRPQGSGNYGQNRAFDGSGNYGQNRAFNGSGFIDRIQGSGASFAPAVMPPDYQEPPAPQALAMPPKPEINPNGTVAACQHAQQAAEQAAAAWRNVLPEARRLAARSLAQDGEEAARHVADLETFTAYYRQAAAANDRAAVNLRNVRGAIENADKLHDWSRAIAGEAEAALQRNDVARAEALAAAAADINQAAQVLGAAAQQALAAYEDAARAFNVTSQAAQAAIERTRASVYHAGYQDTRENFERMAALAKQADDAARNGLADFLKNITPYAGGALIVAAFVAALMLFRR